MSSPRNQLRRVSFSDATVIGTDCDDDRCHRTTVMQDDDLTSTCRDNDKEIENKAERETFYDIWQADDASTCKSDDGYSESTPRIDNYAEDRCGVSGCTFNSDKGQSSQSGNIGEQTVESDERTRGEWVGNGDVCPADRFAGSKGRNDEDDTVWNENLSNSIHKNVDLLGRDEYRMRGGCGGCCCGAREKSCGPRYLSTISSGCCGVNDGAKCGTNGACCRLRLPCECLGGGLDCRRCGRKVYQAEMQNVTSVISDRKDTVMAWEPAYCRLPCEPVSSTVEYRSYTCEGIQV
ncbi:Cysteine and glycine-rich protein 2 [Temnothorax longispinosus]|uniref:Cysteine and glycine-rich protein 2 n=1 Tax=Temnothorax longispinosus TaxID=300112 RepID=A0A4S2KL98_9HYME|nr:Cysteine and glycine-rich protein 2 [Temnothorax longispinosus]